MVGNTSFIGEGTFLKDAYSYKTILETNNVHLEGFLLILSLGEKLSLYRPGALGCDWLVHQHVRISRPMVGLGRRLRGAHRDLVWDTWTLEVRSLVNINVQNKSFPNIHVKFCSN